MAAVAALGLAGTEHSPPIGPLADEDWPSLRTAVRKHRLTGVLLAAAEAGRFPVTDDQHEQLVTDHVRAMAGALLLEELLLEVAGLLDMHGVELRVLKGAAVAHLDYPAPEQRSFGDVDILVRSDQVATTATVLQAHGLTRAYQPPNPAWDREFGKGALFRTGDEAEVDIHRTFATAPLGLRIQLDDLWQPAQPLELAGVTLAALPRELRLLNAAYSAAVADTTPAPATLRDIAQIALHPDLDTPAVKELAARWGGRAVLASAVKATWHQLRLADVTALSSWAETYRPSELERRELALYQEVRAGETARALATARMLPSFTTRMRFLWSLAAADAGFAEHARHRGIGRLLHATRDLRRAARSS